MSSQNDNMESKNEINEKVKKKKKKNMKKRCNHPECKIKLKLSDLECTCKKRFCSKHRVKSSHNCITLLQKIDVNNFKQKNGLGGGEIDKLIKL
tara:strand:- start:4279 stop:4560 length:282 start_codon:yes stop_codon:yes gene_type:complete